ncbi:MAG TPA: hypothetical protein VH621_07030 [Nitrososphaera sp.]
MFAPAVRADFVLGPVVPASDEPVLAASTDRAVLDLFTIFHGMI